MPAKKKTTENTESLELAEAEKPKKSAKKKTTEKTEADSEETSKDDRAKKLAALKEKAAKLAGKVESEGIKIVKNRRWRCSSEERYTRSDRRLS
jgi:hypothetical protein